MDIAFSSYPALEALSEFIAAHAPLCVLSGAGVSTDSGIPDYRDAQGEWKRPAPMTHQTFIGSHAARQRYWARALVGFRALGEALPGPAHLALAALERHGLVNGVITQNVDRLHQAAGSRRVIDLHGRADEVRCMHCDIRMPRAAWHARLAELNPVWAMLDAAIAPDGDAYLEGDFSTFEVPHCPRCGIGVIKPDVVYFGDNVPKARVVDAMALLDESRGLWVVGSSLMVFSGFRFARKASAAGLPIACLNLGRTRADDLYTLKVEAPLGGSLSALAERLGSFAARR